MIYGHYDVQPADPLELWTSAPFDPVVVEGKHGPRVVARGAVDDKGQCSMWLDALRAWHDVAGGPPCRITVLIEGEEETGSPSLDAFLAANREELKADVAIVSDTGMWDIDTPAITTSLRGMVYAQVDLKAAARDLHSGIYGGAARNQQGGAHVAGGNKCGRFGLIADWARHQEGRNWRSLGDTAMVIGQWSSGQSRGRGLSRACLQCEVCLASARLAFGSAVWDACVRSESPAVQATHLRERRACERRGRRGKNERR